MACNITHGRVEPCKDSLGGLKAVYFFNEEPTVWYYTNDWMGDQSPIAAEFPNYGVFRDGVLITDNSLVD